MIFFFFFFSLFFLCSFRMSQGSERKGKKGQKWASQTSPALPQRLKPHPTERDKKDDKIISPSSSSSLDSSRKGLKSSSSPELKNRELSLSLSSFSEASDSLKLSSELLPARPPALRAFLISLVISSPFFGQAKAKKRH